MCAAAIGTETDGSVVCPSYINSVVGIKPTLGLVSRAGIIPIAHSQDTAGPMARTVTDAAMLLGALTGVDARDAATESSAAHAHSDYTQFLKADGLQGKRIGVARNYFGVHEAVDAAMEEALKALTAQGAILVDPANIETSRQWGSSEYEVLLYEFKADLNAYLASLGADAPAKTIDDLIAFNKANPEKEMPFFRQEIFKMANEKGDLTEQAYLDALEKNARLARREGIDKTLAEHELDAIVAPTGGLPWTIDQVTGDHYGGSCSSAAAVAGYPHITVPAGYHYDLPIGLSFFSTAWQEPELIAMAFAYEQATRHRKPPRFLPTVSAARNSQG